MYVIYTAGGTEGPQAALNDHRGVLNHLLGMQRAFGLSSADVMLQQAPLSLDLSVSELLLPLLVGAKLVLAESSQPTRGPWQSLSSCMRSAR